MYVESNFVLEIALGQQQAEAAETILERAECGQIQLALPAFSLSEPFHTVALRGRQRQRLQAQLTEPLRELDRSTLHQQDSKALAAVSGIFAEVNGRESQRLIAFVSRLLAIATILATDAESYREALRYAYIYGLELSDAIIYAAVVAHLASADSPGPHYFINRNWKDFSDPAMIAELDQYRCVVIGSFTEGTVRLDALDRNQANGD